jgi:hypothetical protein
MCKVLMAAMELGADFERWKGMLGKPSQPREGVERSAGRIRMNPKCLITASGAILDSVKLANIVRSYIG